MSTVLLQVDGTLLVLNEPFFNITVKWFIWDSEVHCIALFEVDLKLMKPEYEELNHA